MKVCVVGPLDRAPAEAARDALTRLGLRVELFTHGMSEAYLRELLPQPPSEWTTAPTALEVLWFPSFHPESVVRVWSGEGAAALHLATMQASVSVAHFFPPEWLLARDLSRPDAHAELRAWEESATLDRIRASALFTQARALPPGPPGHPVADGMSAVVTVRFRGAESVQVLGGAWHEKPVAQQFARHLVEIARGSLSGPRSHATLDDLRAYLR